MLNSLAVSFPAVMATALVQNGARVIIASRKEKTLKEVADQLNSASKSAGGGGGSCEYIVADLGSLSLIHI